MEPQVIADAALTTGVVADYSLWALFAKADIVVKAIIIGLAIASLWSWTIIFSKGMRINTVQGRGDRFEDMFWSGKSLEDLYQKLSARPDHPLAKVFVAAMREWHRSVGKGSGREIALTAGLQRRIETVMQVAINREMADLQKGMNYLATLASSAPFIGLFGTVWGIMNAFQRIGVSQSTSLTVVAPAIAEALFATGIGLLAAIPALIFFNRFANRINEYGVRLEGFADEFSAILSRQIEERGGH